MCVSVCDVTLHGHGTALELPSRGNYLQPESRRPPPSCRQPLALNALRSTEKAFRFHFDPMYEGEEEHKQRLFESQSVFVESSPPQAAAVSLACMVAFFGARTTVTEACHLLVQAFASFLEPRREPDIGRHRRVRDDGRTRNYLQHATRTRENRRYRRSEV